MFEHYANKKNSIISSLDYYSKMVEDTYFHKVEFSNDGVHPNKAGYQIRPLC
jgi:lysophospholipase L1-like esterase